MRAALDIEPPKLVKSELLGVDALDTTARADDELRRPPFLERRRMLRRGRSVVQIFERHFDARQFADHLLPQTIPISQVLRPNTSGNTANGNTANLLNRLVELLAGADVQPLEAVTELI